MNQSKKKFEVIKPGVRLDQESSVDEKGALRARTGVRAGVMKPAGLGCGGPDSCLAHRIDNI
jgi:hypothetical protein